MQELRGNRNLRLVLLCRERSGQTVRGLRRQHEERMVRRKVGFEGVGFAEGERALLLQRGPVQRP